MLDVGLWHTAVVTAARLASTTSAADTTQDIVSTQSGDLQLLCDASFSAKTRDRLMRLTGQLSAQDASLDVVACHTPPLLSVSQQVVGVLLRVSHAVGMQCRCWVGFWFILNTFVVYLYLHSDWLLSDPTARCPSDCCVFHCHSITLHEQPNTKKLEHAQQQTTHSAMWYDPLQPTIHSNDAHLTTVVISAPAALAEYKTEKEKKK